MARKTRQRKTGYRPFRRTQRMIKKVGSPVYREVRKRNKPIQRKTGKLMHKAVYKSAKTLNRIPGLTLKDAQKRRRKRAKRTMRGGGFLGLIAGAMGIKKLFGRDDRQPLELTKSGAGENHIHMNLTPGTSLDATSNKMAPITGGSRRTQRRRRKV